MVKALRLSGVAVLVAGVLLAAGAGLAGFIRYQGLQSQPTVDVRIVNSEGVYPPVANPPVARYEVFYSAGGHEQTSHFTTSGTVIQVRDHVAAHPVGGVFTMPYDATDPQRVLPNGDVNPSTMGQYALGVGIGLGLVCFGLAMVCFAVRSPDPL